MNINTKQLLEIAEKIGWSYTQMAPLVYSFYSETRGPLEIHVDDMQKFLAAYHPEDVEGWRDLFRRYPKENKIFFSVITGRPPQFVVGLAYGMGLDEPRFKIKISHEFRQGYSEKRRGLIVQLYNNKKTAYEIALALDISASTVYKTLRKEGIEIRRRGPRDPIIGRKAREPRNSRSPREPREPRSPREPRNPRESLNSRGEQL